MLQLLLGVFLSFFSFVVFLEGTGSSTVCTGWPGLLACRRCAERLNGDRVRSVRPGPLEWSADGAVGLIRVVERVESVRSGRSGGWLPVIGRAGWNWRAVGRLGFVTRDGGEAVRGQKHVRCGCQFAWVEVGRRRE
jgi:hypothetical protein